MTYVSPIYCAGPHGCSSFSAGTQAILLPTDLASVGGRHANSGGDGGAPEGGRTAEEEQNLTCLARGTITSAEGEGMARWDNTRSSNAATAAAFVGPHNLVTFYCDEERVAVHMLLWTL